MNILKELENKNFAQMQYPDRTTAISSALSTMIEICGPYFEIFGIKLLVEVFVVKDTKLFKQITSHGNRIYMFPDMKKKPMNKKWNEQVSNAEMDDELCKLNTLCEMLDKSGRTKEIEITESAEIMLDEFEAKCCDEYTTSRNNPIGAIWGDSHLNALKLSGIHAVANGFYSPLITEQSVFFAIETVEKSIEGCMKAFANNGGKLQSMEEQQRSQMYKLIKNYVEEEPPAVYGEDIKRFREMSLITRSYIQNRLSGCAPFRKDVSGSKDAVYRTLGHFCIQGGLKRLVEGEIDTKAAVFKINKSFFC